ncbi:MAG: hypothetical protein Q9227_000272 [Pyrenula ochraceoflavens]
MCLLTTHIPLVKPYPASFALEDFIQRSSKPPTNSNRPLQDPPPQTSPQFPTPLQNDSSANPSQNNTNDTKTSSTSKSKSSDPATTPTPSLAVQPPTSAPPPAPASSASAPETNPQLPLPPPPIDLPLLIAVHSTISCSCRSETVYFCDGSPKKTFHFWCVGPDPHAPKPFPLNPSLPRRIHQSHRRGQCIPDASDVEVVNDPRGLVGGVYWRRCDGSFRNLMGEWLRGVARGRVEGCVEREWVEWKGQGDERGVVVEGEGG